MNRRGRDLVADLKARVLAIDAGCTLMIDRRELLSIADEKGISIFAVKP